MLGSPPVETFDVDSDLGPSWEIDCVDTADSESELVTDGLRRAASHTSLHTIDRDLDSKKIVVQVVPWVENIVGSLPWAESPRVEC